MSEKWIVWCECVWITEIFRPKEKEIMHLVDKRRQAVGNDNVNDNLNGPTATITLTLTKFDAILIMLAGARIFFITEINGKDRKKQKLVRYAHLLAS